MTNPLRLLGLYRKADALVSTLDDGAKHPTLYREPWYWQRVLAAAGALVAMFPLPPSGRRTMNNVLAKVGMVVGSVVTVAAALQSAPLVPQKYQAMAAIVGGFAGMLAGLLHTSPVPAAK